MRFLVLIIVGIAVYYGWNYYQTNRENIVMPWQKLAADEAAEQQAAVQNASATSVPLPPPEPEFVSKIRTPQSADGKAPPGLVYVTERASTETPDGVVAVVPGDVVKLLQRRDDGTVRVTNDQADFELTEKQVTRDPEVARAAEKRAFEARRLRR